MKSRKKKEIIVMCGTSHCGKSTYTRQFKGYALINSDTIRMNLTGTTQLGEKEEAVWRVFNELKLDSVKKKENIILDACHITPQSRWHALQGVDGYKKVCVLFIVKLKTIKERCKEKWAEDMWRSFKKVRPTREQLITEGFDEVVIIKEVK